MDKSGANYAGLANINFLLILAGFATLIDICQVKYLNNIIEHLRQWNYTAIPDATTL
jgi:putative transposase